MISKRISALLMLALILGTLGAIIYHGWLYGISFPTYNRFYFMSEYMADIEEYMQANFPFSKQLKNSAVRLQMLSGEHEFNKIFIGGDILIESLNQPQAEVLAKNQEEIQKFAESVSTPTHVLYLPTKYAIKQKELPENAELFAFNQKNFIEQSYSALQGKATTVDVYPLLFANSDKYLYYRTDPNLTGLGAYYVYTALIQRLGLSPLGQEDFNLRHIQHDFYGSTYQDSAYKEITPDIVTLYQPRSAARSYTVTHNNDYEYTYNTLYPEHLQDLKGGLSVILGGDTGDITIGANLRKQKSLLVFGDSSFMPVLPLLTAHYSKIHFIDFQHWNSNALEELDIDDYDQVLLAYSVDTIIHEKYPAKLAQVRRHQEKLNSANS